MGVLPTIAAVGGSWHVSSKTISLFPECSKLPETKVKVQEVSLSSSFPSRLPWRKTRTGVNLKECVLCEEKKKRRTEQRRASKDFKGSVGALPANHRPSRPNSGCENAQPLCI